MKTNVQCQSTRHNKHKTYEKAVDSLLNTSHFLQKQSQTRIFFFLEHGCRNVMQSPYWHLHSPHKNALGTTRKQTHKKETFRGATLPLSNKKVTIKKQHMQRSLLMQVFTDVHVA